MREPRETDQNLPLMRAAANSDLAFLEGRSSSLKSRQTRPVLSLVPPRKPVAVYCYNPRRELISSDRRIGNQHTVTNYRYDLSHNRTGQNQFSYQHNNADQLLTYPGPGGARALAYMRLSST